MIKLQNFSLLCCCVGFLLGLTACQDPEQTYFQEIQKNGFIPFQHPMGGVGTGTMIRGTPDSLFMLAPPAHCMPYNIDGKPSELRWITDTAIASKHYSATLNFNAHVNSIVAAGTPAFTFKFDLQNIKRINMEMRDAKIEMIDQLNLEDYFNQRMSDSCKQRMTTYPFVLNGLVATEMAFTFYDEWGVKVALDMDKIKQIVDIALNVDWKIVNDYTLVFTTPKFIGYHLAKLRTDDKGFVRIVSVETDENGFIWKDIDNPENEMNYVKALSWPLE